jgi:DNA polymerase-3 subunit alpha
VERKEGIPRVVALELEELHLEPGLDPLYLRAVAFEGKPSSLVHEAFDIIARHPGGSPLVLVSDDGTLEEAIFSVEDSSDLHAELKQLLGARCISAVRPVREPEMEQVS